MKRAVFLAVGRSAPLVAALALAAPATVLSMGRQDLLAADGTAARAPKPSGGPAAGTPAQAPSKREQPKKSSGPVYATFETTAGKIGVKLLPQEAPNAVDNFVALATGKKEWTDPRTGKKSHQPLYDGTVFHRVIPGFMIQGGDPLGQGVGGPGYSFPDEIKPGTTPFAEPCQLAYANSGPNTNGSQFFITEVATPHLNPRPCENSPSGVCGYVRFGVGVCGCDLVRPIALAGNSRTTLTRVVISSTPPTCK